MSKKRKRVSRRRLAGQRVLAHVATHNLETGEHKPVTAARRFIAEGNIVPPAILNVRRNEHTTDRFFWGEKGLFSAQYAEENHFLFPSLRAIVDRIGEDTLFAGLEAMAADDWEEMEEYEYAFVLALRQPMRPQPALSRGRFFASSPLLSACPARLSAR